VRHDLEIRLDFNKSPIFKQIGLYSNAKNFNQDTKLAKSSGYFSYKILEGLWFYQNYSKQEKENCLNLLQDLLVVYRIESNLIQRNEALIKLVYPTMNTERFMRSDKVDEMKDNESNSIKQNDAEGNQTNANGMIKGASDSSNNNNQENNDNNNNNSDNINKNSNFVFANGNEEEYFVQLEKIYEYENIIKLINAERKEKQIWSLSLYKYDTEDDEADRKKTENLRTALSAKYRKSIKILREETESLNQETSQLECDEVNDTTLLDNLFMNSIEQEFKHIKGYNDIKIDMKMFEYKHMQHIEIIFQIDFDANIFQKLSVVLHQLFYERIDSSDCIIARDVANNFFKIELQQSQPMLNKIIVDVKSIDKEHAVEIKQKFMSSLDILFSFYPGLIYLKQVHSKISD